MSQAPQNPKVRAVRLAATNDPTGTLTSRCESAGVRAQYEAFTPPPLSVLAVQRIVSLAIHSLLLLMVRGTKSMTSYHMIASNLHAVASR